MQKPKMGSYFSCDRLLATRTYEMMTEKRFLLLLKFLHFTDNETASSKNLQSETCV
jgi:hypothetical protein